MPAFTTRWLESIKVSKQTDFVDRGELISIDVSYMERMVYATHVALREIDFG
jgi:hypothetical protein